MRKKLWTKKIFNQRETFKKHFGKIGKMTEKPLKNNAKKKKKTLKKHVLKKSDSCEKKDPS